ncbi:unnamed protein product [Polarella glacialis]|uniref:Calmodulin n=1 Tax=Polarella glacialis TaxID=89957 RepID=A0A813GDF7_POLGL|nr:unnamed protein product [Polarella glacialis]
MALRLCSCLLAAPLLWHLAGSSSEVCSAALNEESDSGPPLFDNVTIKFVIPNATSYAVGEAVRSPSVVLETTGWRFRLLVFPAGTGAYGESVTGAYVESEPPDSFDEDWSYRNVSFSIRLQNSRNKSRSMLKADIWNFSKTGSDRGWGSWVPSNDLRAGGWLTKDGQLSVAAKISTRIDFIIQPGVLVEALKGYIDDDGTDYYRIGDLGTVRRVNGVSECSSYFEIFWPRTWETTVWERERRLSKPDWMDEYRFVKQQVLCEGSVLQAIDDHVDKHGNELRRAGDLGVASLTQGQLRISWARTGRSSKHRLSTWMHNFVFLELRPGALLQARSEFVDDGVEVNRPGDMGTLQSFVQEGNGTMMEIYWASSGQVSLSERISWRRDYIFVKQQVLYEGVVLQAIDGHVDKEEFCQAGDFGKVVSLGSPGPGPELVGRKFRITWARTGRSSNHSLSSWMQRFAIFELRPGALLQARGDFVQDGEEMYRPEDQGTLQSLFKAGNISMMSIYWARTARVTRLKVVRWLDHFDFLMQQVLYEEAVLVARRDESGADGQEVFKFGDHGIIAQLKWQGGQSRIMVYWQRTELFSSHPQETWMEHFHILSQSSCSATCGNHEPHLYSSLTFENVVREMQTFFGTTVGEKCLLDKFQSADVDDNGLLSVAEGARFHELAMDCSHSMFESSVESTAAADDDDGFPRSLENLLEEISTEYPHLHGLRSIRASLEAADADKNGQVSHVEYDVFLRMLDRDLATTRSRVADESDTSAPEGFDFDLPFADEGSVTVVLGIILASLLAFAVWLLPPMLRRALGSACHGLVVMSISAALYCLTATLQRFRKQSSGRTYASADAARKSPKSSLAQADNNRNNNLKGARTSKGAEKTVQCERCLEAVGSKELLRTHLKHACTMRRVECSFCRQRCSFCDLIDHQQHACAQRPVVCPLCQETCSAEGMGHHTEHLCELREVECSNSGRGCGWRGLGRELGPHESLACPCSTVTCTWCLEELEQRRMPGHVCPKVLAGDQCIVCFESFESLAQSRVLPAILLLGSRRTCVHFGTCCRCANDWNVQTPGRAQCPVCRKLYDGVTVVPANLIVPEEFAPETCSMQLCQFQRPLPPREKMVTGTTWFVSPLDIRFTHNSICDHFLPFEKDGEVRRLSILDSIQELLRPFEEPKELQIIDVVWHEGNLHVAGTFNRRLCMYRLLALFASERFGLIKVRVLNKDLPRLRFDEKLTTRCEGLTVEVRYGRQRQEQQQQQRFVGCSREEVLWNEAREMLDPRWGKSAAVSHVAEPIAQQPNPKDGYPADHSDNAEAVEEYIEADCTKQSSTEKVRGKMMQNTFHLPQEKELDLPGGRLPSSGKLDSCKSRSLRPLQARLEAVLHGEAFPSLGAAYPKQTESEPKTWFRPWNQTTGTAFESLLGWWGDSSDSKYELTTYLPGRSLTVRTLRSTGEVRCTQGLIRVESDAAGMRSVLFEEGEVCQKWYRLPVSLADPALMPAGPSMIMPERICVRYAGVSADMQFDCKCAVGCVKVGIDYLAARHCSSVDPRADGRSMCECCQSIMAKGICLQHALDTWQWATFCRSFLVMGVGMGSGPLSVFARVAVPRNRRSLWTFCPELLAFDDPAKATTAVADVSIWVGVLRSLSEHMFTSSAEEFRRQIEQVADTTCALARAGAVHFIPHCRFSLAGKSEDKILSEDLQDAPACFPMEERSGNTRMKAGLSHGICSSVKHCLRLCEGLGAFFEQSQAIRARQSISSCGCFPRSGCLSIIAFAYATRAYNIMGTVRCMQKQKVNFYEQHLFANACVWPCVRDVPLVRKLPASADRAAESAQRLASQTDEGLQSVRGSFLASVGAAWQGQRASAAELEASELMRHFRAEAESMANSFADEPNGVFGSDPTMETATKSASSVALAARTLNVWRRRLDGDAEDGGRLTAPGLRGLLRSQGLKVALEAFSKSGQHRQPVFRAAARWAAEVEANDALDHSANGPEEVHVEDNGRPLSASMNFKDEAAGQELAGLLLRASEAPSELIVRLLHLLAESAEAADRCKSGALLAEATAAEEDLRWVIQVILATLPESCEADALASSRLCGALKKVMVAADSKSAVCRCGPSRNSFSSSLPDRTGNSGALSGFGTPGKIAPFSGGGRPVVGSEVWACWPVDGNWYRASIKGFCGRDRVKVIWSPDPGNGCSSPSEYVANASRGSDGAVFSELSNTAVMMVDATIRRPPPAPESQTPGSHWNAVLESVEAHGQQFRDLRRLGKQLDFHRDWWQQGLNSGGGGSSSSRAPAVAAKSEISKWRYAPHDGCHMDVRAAPMIGGMRSSSILIAGEIFDVCQSLVGADGVLYLKLSDGRGWVFDKKPGVGALCVRCEDSDEEEELLPDEVPEQIAPLSGAAESLSALRVEIEERAEALGIVASEREEEARTFKDQILCSTSAMRTELEALHSEREVAVVREDGLRMRREELLTQLLAVEEDLRQAEVDRRELDAREQNLNASRARVSEELDQQLEIAQEHRVLASCRQRVLLASVDAAKSVQEQIAERAAAASEAAQESCKLRSQEQLVGVGAFSLSSEQVLAAAHVVVAALGRTHFTVHSPVFDFVTLLASVNLSAATF